MRAKTIAVLSAAVAILLALAIPAGASAAKAQRVREPASIDAEVHGPGTDGFHFVFFTFGSRGTITWFTKRASPGGEESVIYFVRPQGRAGFDAGALDVKIGGSGHFRGHFIPTSTRTRKPQNGCTGDPTTTEKGFFVGSFSFHGERGYTTVHAHRERGTVTKQGAESCPVPKPPRYGGHHGSSRQAKEEKERRQNEFRLIAGDNGADLLLRAEREESAEPEEGSPTSFQASVSEEVGRMGVSRSASVIDFGDAAATTFQTPNLAEPLAEATLAPPAPFSGSATFHLDDPRTATWSGDLAVEMPGLGRLPLTGEDIHAGICKGLSHCTKTLPGLLQRQLEAGPGVVYFGGVATTKVPSHRSD